MIKYNLRNRVNPQDVTATQKFYPVKKTQEAFVMRDLAKRISNESTISMMDTMAVLEAFLQIIPNELLRGNIVKLGDFGTFRTTLSGVGVTTEDEFNAATHITNLNVRFRPAKEFNKLLLGVQYSRAS